MTIADEIAGKRFVRTEYLDCPICGGENQSRPITTQFGQTAMVADCQECRLGYQTPRPTLEASIAYMDWRWSSEDSYVRDNQSKRNTAAKQLAIVQGQVGGKRVRILDFGAGSGAFVKAASVAGHDVVGVEHSQGAIDRAREDYGVAILKEIPQGETFDVVTMWDVIEHLRDPIGVLNMLHSVLSPGGVVIIETGNYDFWERLILGDRWKLYLFDHQFYFTPASLAKTVSLAGYKETKFLRVGNRKPKFRLSRPVVSARNVLAGLKARRKSPNQYDIPLLYAVAKK